MRPTCENIYHGIISSATTNVVATRPMRRIQFIELHEQSWYPSPLRDGLTDALQFGFDLLNMYAPITPLLESVIGATLGRPDSAPSEHGRSIVDLCSGGAGPWLNLSRRLKPRNAGSEAAEVDIQISLTDKYPNLRAFENIRVASEDRITFYPGSVDAMKVPGDLKGLRTMFTSFHHFPPDEARAILQNAVDAGEGIAIFESPRRSPSTIALVFPLVLLLFVCTPWIRPFRWSRMLWTFLIPIIPLALSFDGVVSCLRAYRPQELRQMVAELTASGCQYHWEIGERAGAIPGAPITYLIGYPVRDPVG